MKIVKFFLRHLSKTSKPEQENPETEKKDFADLWQDLSEDGREQLKKEMSQTASVRTLGEHPQSN